MEVDVSSIRYSVGASLKVELKERWGAITWGGEEVKLLDPVTVKLTITNTGELLLANGRLETSLLLTCSRCLERFPYALEAPFVIGYREVKKKMPEEPEDEDLEVRGFTGDRIDITDDVRDTLYLALPMKPLCRQDCLGLCPRCGKNLNEGPCTCEKEDPDPRLAVLRDLLKQE
ncbi:MAG: YceD family protein [Desulfofundulus sp.]